MTGVNQTNPPTQVALPLKARRKRNRLQRPGRSQPKSVPAIPRSFPSSETPLSESIRKLTIPRNEQDRLIGFLNSQSDPAVVNYLNCLVCPKNMMSRIPDSFARPTALVRSIITYNIPAYIDGTSNSGRFSVAIQPVLGATENIDPKDWKVALVNSTGTWPTDFTQINSFTQIGGGSDLRVDPFFPTLTQPIPGYLKGVSSTPGNSGPFDLGTTNFSVDAGYSINIGFSIGTGGSAGRWYLPPGAYVVEVTIANANPTTISITNSNPTNLVMMININATTNPTNTFVLNVQNPGEWFRIAQNVLTSTAVHVSISTTLTASGGAPTDYGLVTQIRPVAMSALASYIGTTLQDGGDIAAAYVPGGTLESNYFTNASANSPLGCFEFWEALSKQPTSYNGPIRDGAYVWWSPEDYEDLQMAKPSGIDDHNFPAIIISGQFLPGPYVAPPSTVPVIRLEVVTVYEFVTNSLLFETAASMGSQAMMDTASMALFGQPHAMPNAMHMKWLSDLAKGIRSGIGSGARFISRNADKLVPLIGTVGSLL